MRPIFKLPKVRKAFYMVSVLYFLALKHTFGDLPYRCSSGIIYILQINNFFSFFLPRSVAINNIQVALKDWLDLWKSVSTKSGENGSFSSTRNIFH